MTLYPQLLDELRRNIQALGTQGGKIGPSVYDTALVLLYAPPADPRDAYTWLRTQQQPDGGWGDPRIPRARDTPTLAALLALHDLDDPSDHRRIASGLAFLAQHSQIWHGPVPNDIPLAAELLIPHLLDLAQRHGMPLDRQPYEGLAALGQKRRDLIARLRPRLRPATSPIHSWESWGDDVDAHLFDLAGCIGHSPAATARWLHDFADRECPANLREAARAYLDAAAYATGLDIPGVVPTVWPYNRNEQTVSMFCLLLAGSLDHPELQDALQPQIDSMRQGLRATGQGISDEFSTDGDLTSMVLAVLSHAGHAVDPGMLDAYLVDGWCLTYANELQRSFSATVHAAHAQAMLGGDPAALFQRLEAARSDDGRWVDDKWHASWLYLTGHAMHALCAAGRAQDAAAVVPTMIAHQHPDGSWGVTSAYAEETAYGMVGMLAAARAGVLEVAGHESLRRATAWMAAYYRSGGTELGGCWAAKELYRPLRISRVIELSALLAGIDAGYGEL
ncbi:hypothetical protein F8S13_02065 [Chloroflexia bacterium SDU3-3]|nr:hypothetical protein F8S13_02065 [Chloroflexia bacterium SDU3-3]